MQSSRSTADGTVQQETLLSLGTNFEPNPEKWQLLSNRINEIVSGQQSLSLLDEIIEELAQVLLNK